MTSMISRFGKQKQVDKQKQATTELGRDLSVMVRLLRFPIRVGKPSDQILRAGGELSVSEERRA